MPSTKRPNISHHSGFPSFDRAGDLERLEPTPSPVPAKYGIPEPAKTPVKKMSGSEIYHVVMFTFKPELSGEEVHEFCENMLALQQKCLHPTHNTPYVKLAIGGVNNSPEGLNKGITHIFILTFTSESDRAYYLATDPAHLALAARAKEIITVVQVLDFTPGVFA